jgi:hypothetical protein
MREGDERVAVELGAPPASRLNRWDSTGHDTYVRLSSPALNLQGLPGCAQLNGYTAEVRNAKKTEGDA